MHTGFTQGLFVQDGASEQTIGALRKTEWGPCGRVVERLTGYDVGNHLQCVATACEALWGFGLVTAACVHPDFFACATALLLILSRDLCFWANSFLQLLVDRLKARPVAVVPCSLQPLDLILLIVQFWWLNQTQLGEVSVKAAATPLV